MNRKEVAAYIKKKYKANPEALWARYPKHHVFRHKDNNKWFAVVMDIEKSKIGLEGSEHIDVLDVKCEKEMVASLVETEGYYPAYHMNKVNWITVALDAKLSDDTIKSLIDLSYGMTESKRRVL